MNRKINNLFNAVTAGLLSLLGFSSCSNNDDNEIPCLYGTPTSTYHFKGTVTDEHGTPIKGIKVVTQVKQDDKAIRVDSTYTDSDGSYQTADKMSVSTPSYYVKNGIMSVSFEDVDGQENGGEFETAKSVGDDINVKQTENGHGSWDRGKFELTADKKLKKK